MSASKLIHWQANKHSVECLIPVLNTTDNQAGQFHNIPFVVRSNRWAMKVSYIIIFVLFSLYLNILLTLNVRGPS